MISFKQFSKNDSDQIIVEKKHGVYRDGGSHFHKVLNSKETGYCLVVQDFSVHSKKNGTHGDWNLTPNPPNHTQRIKTDPSHIRFV